MMKKEAKSLQGTISITSKATGYVKINTLEQDLEIDYKHLNTALHGDTVEIILHPKGSGRQGGEVIKILNRAKMKFTGVLEKKMRYIS